MPAAGRGWFRRVAASFHRHVRYRITRSGYLFTTALIIVGAAALLSANNLLFLILAAMMATFMISGFVSRLSLAGLELELLLPEHISARQPVAARVRLRNLKWLPSFAIQLSSRPGASVQILRDEIVFPLMSGRSSVTADVRVEFPRRGLHQENLFVITTRFPFGFVERRSWVSIRSEAVVYPALLATFPLEELLDDLRGELERERRGLGSDFYRVRPYEFHESARYVDWKVSAHTRALQVREFSREERSTIYVFFDLAIPAGDIFEQAIERCAYLMWSLSEESVRIRFRTQSADLVFPDQVDVYEILRALALAGSDAAAEIPDPAESEPQLLFTMRASAWEEAGWRSERTIVAETLT